MIAVLAAKGQTIRFDDSLFSTAGFHKLDNTDSRLVYSFNNGWYFYKGDISGAYKADYAVTSEWKQVQLPHGVDILPEEASGGVNYQGVVWYRKSFKLPKKVAGKKLTLHFEAVMGRCTVWLNGHLVAQHTGGYLPVIIDLTKNNVHYDRENVIALRADNSDDARYPPGKPQYAMDFTYMGGIYRDVWLIATESVHITDPNTANQVAGGGVFVHYENVSDQSAEVLVETNILNESSRTAELTVEASLVDAAHNTLQKQQKNIQLSASESGITKHSLVIANPRLWSPDHPSLYRLYIRLKNPQGKVVDGYYQNIGIRSIEFNSAGRLYLNGKPFEDKLVGANHHQDYAVIGNAMTNNLHWHDAKLMRDAGIRIVRGSHYPQDPAFMDACDQLGIFVIVCTPGWQFWNKDSAFAAHIYDDVRQMIRRDRNHPSVFAWEPVPNETSYPAAFAEKVYAVTHAEYPYKNCIAATNAGSQKAYMFDLLYAHPNEYLKEKERAEDTKISKSQREQIQAELRKPFFTREWGDNVDNWNAQNSDSRAARSWGEMPQIVQAIHYSNADSADRSGLYATDWEALYEAPAGHLGGCLWHFFDTQRGYHPDPFYGGLVDGFRQTKYAYYLFKSQQDPKSEYFNLTGQSPFTLFIANELSPFSPPDITVFTNCDSVRLTVFGKNAGIQAPDPHLKMPHSPIIFKNAFHFRYLKGINPSEASVKAEGFKDGKVVIVVNKEPGFRPAALKLSTTAFPGEMVADGSTVIPITVTMLDNEGHVKRLNDQLVRLKVTGAARLISNADIAENPKRIQWGTAAMLIKTNMTPGPVTIIASPIIEGATTVKSDTLIFNTIAASMPSIYNVNDVNDLESYQDSDSPNKNPRSPKPAAKIIEEQLKKVEAGQKRFQTNPQ